MKFPLEEALLAELLLWPPNGFLCFCPCPASICSQRCSPSEHFKSCFRPRTAPLKAPPRFRGRLEGLAMAGKASWRPPSLTAPPASRPLAHIPATGPSGFPPTGHTQGLHVPCLLCLPHSSSILAWLPPSLTSRFAHILPSLGHLAQGLRPPLLAHPPSSFSLPYSSLFDVFLFSVALTVF